MREQVGTRETGSQREEKKEPNDREKKREREKGGVPSMTSKEITHSPELLFSCYHFPRQHSIHIRLEKGLCVNFSNLKYMSGSRTNTAYYRERKHDI